MASHSNGHAAHQIDRLSLTPQEVREDLVNRVLQPGPGARRTLLISGILALLGIVGIILRAVVSGFDEFVPWGYYAATTGFLLTTAMAAPLVAFAFRLAKANWRRPLTRVAEMWGATSILLVILLIPLLILLPSNEDRFTVWFFWPHAAPHLWLIVGFAVFIVASYISLWIPALPDLATLRDAAPGRGLFRRKALGWSGTTRQWRVLLDGLTFTGAFFFMNLIFAHFLYPADFALALVPGWKDAIFPAYHALTALQGGIATTIVTLYVLRCWGGYQEYIRLEQFWALSKPLLAVSLLWFYFWWSGFIIYWYGRLPAEQGVLRLLMFETYRTPFFIAFALCFIVPLTTLIWNPVRKSIKGPTIVSSIILVGLFFDRIRIYTGAFSIPKEELGHHVLETLPAAHLPDGIDALIIVGALSGAVFVYALATRVLPPISIWEVREGLLVTAVRPFLRSVFAVVGKTR